MNVAATGTSLHRFTGLVNQHRPQLTSFLYRFTASKEDAEDLAQETFAKAFQQLHLFKGDSSFKTWLFAIAANLAKDHARARQRWPVHAQDNCKALVGGTPQLAAQLHYINKTAEYGKYEIREHIDFCFTCIMKTIPLEQQLSLMLADIYDFKVKEIAEILGVTQAVIKHHLHRARHSMQTIFEKRCALINKEGICHQCSELNGFTNTKAETQRLINEMELAKAAQNPGKKRLFTMRAAIVKAIDPLNAKGASLHDFLLQCTQKANEAG